MSSAWITIAQASTRYAVSGVRGIPRSKGTAASDDGLVIKFERAVGLMARHESAMPRAGSASTRAENVFVDGELFTVLAVLVCLHLVERNL